LIVRASQQGRSLDETGAELLRAGLAPSAAVQTTLQVDDSMLAERKRIVEKFLSGEWGVELSGVESFSFDRAADSLSAAIHARRRVGDRRFEDPPCSSLRTSSACVEASTVNPEIPE
jgi:hypothetical protein